MEYVELNMKYIDAVNEIERVATELGCHITPMLEKRLGEDVIILSFHHSDNNIIRFMTYLAHKYLLEVQQLNSLLVEEKKEELNLSGLNMIDNTEKYKIPM